MKIGRGWIGVVVLSVALACGGDGDDDGDGSGTTADSGSGPAADASGGRADGGDGGGEPDGGRFDASGPDGGDPDGALDASLPDASTAPGLVTVTVGWSDLPVEGHTVFFLRADDSVIDIVTTDQDGRAAAMLDEPGTVVILIEQGTTPWLHRLTAYLAVPPGTDIFNGNGITGQTGSLTVTGPTVEDPYFYAAETPCGVNYSQPDSATVSVDLTRCGFRTPVVWAAYVAVGAEILGFSAFAPDVPVEPGATLAVKGPLREDVLQTTRVTGLPEGEVWSASYRIHSGRYVVQEGSLVYSPPFVDGTVELVDRFHDLGGRGLMGGAYVLFSRAEYNSTDYWAWVDHDGAPVVDVSAMVPPVLAFGWVHRADGTWTWTEKSAGAVDGLYATIGINLSEAESVLWRVLAPNDGSEVRIPRLPAPYDQFHLQPTSLTNSPSLQHVGHTRGYRALLEDVEGALYYGGQPGDLVASTRSFTLVD